MFFVRNIVLYLCIIKNKRFMKTYTTPIQKIAKTGYCFGTFPKTYVTGNCGDVITIIGETKAYYITDNTKNPKLPKWVVE